MDNELLKRYGAPVPRYTSYPTAPHFHDGIDSTRFEAWLADLPKETDLSLYLHVPFCDTLCWFCGCHTKIVQRYQPVADYVTLLRQEIALLAERLGSGHRVTRVHFGGGSPSLLTPADLSGLFTDLRTAFDFAPDAEIAIEIDPRDLSDETVASLAAVGVTRASFGVQDINPEVQQAINRIQPPEVTASAVRRLRDAGVGGINLDLMYGLPYQSLERVLASVASGIALRPDRVALFGYAHVPGFKKHQRMIPEDALPTPEDRWAHSEAAADALMEAGYRRIGFDHFAHPDDPMAKAFDAGELRRNFQGYVDDDAACQLGLGASAIGALPQGYVQNAVPLHDYRDAITDGHFAVSRGIALDDDDRLRRDLINRVMCDLQTEIPASGFGVERARLQSMAADGLIEMTQRGFTVTERGRPLLRSIAAVFDRYLAGSGAKHSQAV